LDDVKVPGDALLGGETGKGFRFAMQSLDNGRISVGATATFLVLFGADPTNMSASWFLLTPFSFVVLKSMSLVQILPVLGLQLGVISGLIMQLNRQLRHSGESTTDRLVRGEMSTKLRE
ncbi:MAG: hypothetical protein AAF329_08645, partial [Cyanobacteria bacterium P01_A01_bin.17]